MTAIVTRPPSVRPSDGPRRGGYADGRRRGGYADGRRPGGYTDLLRFAMRADATLCAGIGALTAAAADPIARLSGLSATSEWITGAALALYGAAIYVLAAVPALRRVGLGIVVANVVIAAVTMAVLGSGVLTLTPAGLAMMLVIVAGSLGFAWLQYLGVRRLA